MQPRVGSVAHLGPGAATPRPAHAAHLEDVGEVAGEGEREREGDALRPVVGDGDALVQRALVQVDGARDMHRVLGKHDVLVGVDVGVGEVDLQVEVVVPDGGAEQQRLGAVDQELEVGEVARVAVEQPVRPAGGGADVAVAVEHREGIVVLQRAPRARRRSGGGDRELSIVARRLRRRCQHRRLGSAGRHRRLEERCGLRPNSARRLSHASGLPWRRGPQRRGAADFPASRLRSRGESRRRR